LERDERGSAVMELSNVNYQDLNSRQKEIYNSQKVAALLADNGFNCIKLADDWQEAYFIAYHKDGNDTLKVQLKPRPIIEKKYCQDNIYLVLPLTAYPPASGATECCDGRGRFVLEQITNITTFGGPDDRFSPFLDRVPAALLG
jgi:hypothetical protein